MLGWKLGQMHISEEKIKKEISEDSGIQESILQQENKEQTTQSLFTLFTLKEYDSTEKFYLILRLVTTKCLATL